MPETLIKVENISKKFCHNLKASLWYGVQDLAQELLLVRKNNNQLRPAEFHALKNVNFEVKRGECLGLIGHNGAGKTTLLRMLNGLIKPSSGRIEMRGRVGALISLGATVQPVLSGRENIYINASLRGYLKSEINAKLEEIIDFANIDAFIDTPMKYYSSGMSVRLNFAVAAAFSPDILLLDEVLAVGDAAFRNKCYHRIATISKNSAIIFVSHNMEQVARICTHALVLDKGVPAKLGSVDSCINLYNRLNQKSSSKEKTDEPFLSVHPPINGFKAVLADKRLISGEPWECSLQLSLTEDLPFFLFKIHFYNAIGMFAADGVVKDEHHNMRLVKGKNNINVKLPSVPLKNGVYKVAFNIIDRSGDLIVWSYKQHEVMIEGAYEGSISDCQMKPEIQFEI